MTLAEIKHEVTNGQTVCWANTGYRVISNGSGYYLIVCQQNQHCIGLTWKDGTTMNGRPSEFFIAPSDSQ